MLEHVGIKVNTRKLTKEEFNAAEQAGDFHLSFSETWGSPYDPHAYAAGWLAGDEGHQQAMKGIDYQSLFDDIEDVLREEDHVKRGTKWGAIHKTVHDSATMLPLWGSCIPTVINSNRLRNYQAGNQQFDYPVHLLEVTDDLSKEVTIAPGAQTGRFNSVGRLEPHTYRPNEFFSNNWIYEGLVSYGTQGQVHPALAHDWDREDEDGGEKYTFYLRQNVKFHDGEEWNCAAAKLNFDHVLAGPLRTPDWHGWYGLMSQIKSYECNDDGDLVVKTKDKYYPFLQELTFIRPLRMLSPGSFVGDKDPFTSNSCAVGWSSDGPITYNGESVTCAGISGFAGTGPFKFDSRTATADGEGDAEVVFVRNAEYWDGAPSIERLIIKRYESSADIKQALLDGSLDIVWGGGVLSAEDLTTLDEDETNDLSVFYSDDMNNAIMLLNSGKAPLDDIDIRKTIIHAIDKQSIIDGELGGIFKSVDNVFPRDAPYCDVDMTPRWDYDLEKAAFLNCPAPPSRALALGLGLGLGLTSLILVGVAIVKSRKTQVLEEELEELKLKVGATSA